MQNFNLHTHTYRCHHATGGDEQYIRAAIDAGMTTIGFSEHLPYPGVEVESERMFNKDLSEYFMTMRALKEKYHGQIEILVGVEFEYYDNRVDYLQEISKMCDYMIIGQHYRYDDHYHYDQYCSDEDVLIYAKQIIKALNLGLTRYVAHPDFFMLGRRSFSKACKQATQMICEAALKYDAVLEINMNGLHYGKLYYSPGMRYCYPYRDFFKIVSVYNNKVCFGFDAHSPVTLLEHKRYNECMRILHGLTFHFVHNVEECLIKK